MILKGNDLNPLIIFDNYSEVPVDHIPISYKSFSCAAIKITKKDIPKQFYVEEILEEVIMVGMPFDYIKPKGTGYLIRLKNNIVLNFTDKVTANLYFSILCSDFEKINMKEKHPELFL